MGLVYRAKDLKPRRVCRAQAGERAAGHAACASRQEALVLAEIAHPAIVRYLAHGSTARGEQYLVMEWLEGETLEDRVSRGPLRISETLQLGRRVAEALTVAHRHGVIHRDIKRSHVFLLAAIPARPRCWTSGIARRLFDPRQNLRITSASAAWARLCTWRPNRRAGASTVDGRADIFPWAACSSNVSPASRPLPATRPPRSWPRSASTIRWTWPASDPKPRPNLWSR